MIRTEITNTKDLSNKRVHKNKRSLEKFKEKIQSIPQCQITIRKEITNTKELSNKPIHKTKDPLRNLSKEYSLTQNALAKVQHDSIDLMKLDDVQK